jgi:hypothetical protein
MSIATSSLASARDSLIAALDVIDLSISTGAVQWDRTSPGPLRDRRLALLQQLVDARQEIQATLVNIDLDSPEAIAAAAALDRIADENAEVAERLVVVTGWLEAAAKVLGQATKLVGELKKLEKS